MKIINEIKDGLPIKRIADEKYGYSYGYYSANKWVDNNRLVLVRGIGTTLSEFNKYAQLVLIDIEKQTEELLLTFNERTEKSIGAGHGEGYVVHNNDIYYIDGTNENGVYEEVLYHFNLQSRKNEELYRGNNFYFPHITDDGRYINIEVLATNENEKYACVVINTVTKKAERIFEKRFSKPFNEIGHIMINPKTDDEIFFCHEGDTFYVSNRLWMYKKNKGIYPLAKQKLDDESNLGDCFGHECWSHDGRGLYFVKYKCSPLPPTGLCYVDTEGNQTDVIYSKYNYWHVCCAPNGRYLASDTQDETYSGVCLVDMENGEEKMVFKADTTWSHPTHPHPCFSPNTDKLVFHELYGDKVSVVLSNIADIF